MFLTTIYFIKHYPTPLESRYFFYLEYKTHKLFQRTPHYFSLLFYSYIWSANHYKTLPFIFFYHPTKN